jgi:hypothetical protein
MKVFTHYYEAVMHCVNKAPLAQLVRATDS